MQNIEMNAALRAKCDEIRDCFRSFNSVDVEKRLEIGGIAKEVKENAENRYGNRAIEKTADFLKCHPSFLYETAKVAEIWDSESAMQLIQRGQDNEVIVSWSHFKFLSEVENAELRNQLIEAMIEDQLSVRGLLQRKQLLSREDHSENDNSEEPQPPAQNELIETMANHGMILNSNARTLFSHGRSGNIEFLHEEKRKIRLTVQCLERTLEVLRGIEDLIEIPPEEEQTEDDSE